MLLNAFSGDTSDLQNAGQKISAAEQAAQAAGATQDELNQVSNNLFQINRD